MLVRLFFWWLAQLVAVARGDRGDCPRTGVIVDMGCGGALAASVWQRNGKCSPVAVDVAARLARRKVVLLRLPAGSVLQKRHTVPVAASRQMGPLLRHEIGRVTPFSAEELLWRWDAEASVVGQAKAAVTLTMIPKAALAPALAKLRDVGMKVDGVLTDLAGRPRLLPIGGERNRTEGAALLRGLVWTCGCLAVVAVGLPVGVLALGLYQTENAIAELRPAVAEVEALRRKAASAETSRRLLKHEAERGGDVLGFLASVTRSLPDDTFLTDISVRQRHITFSGRSTSAPGLVAILSADPGIRAVAFSAPVTRVEGAARDIFSMQAEMAGP